MKPIVVQDRIVVFRKKCSESDPYAWRQTCEIWIQRCRSSWFPAWPDYSPNDPDKHCISEMSRHVDLRRNNKILTTVFSMVIERKKNQSTRASCFRLCMYSLDDEHLLSYLYPVFSSTWTRRRNVIYIHYDVHNHIERIAFLSNHSKLGMNVSHECVIALFIHTVHIHRTIPE